MAPASRRFFGGRYRRNFNSRRFQNPRAGASKRRVVRRTPVRSSRRVTTQAVQVFRFYVGTLQKAGILIPLGPDKSYGTSSYFVSSRSWNNYRLSSVSLEYTPLVNQTTAVSMVNAYLTNDLSAKIPANDVDMKNNTVNHNGAEWFAANRVVKRFKIPTLKQNTYETGSGEGTDTGSSFENCASLIVKPTSLADDQAIGELYLKVGVIFSGPAAPSLSAGSAVYSGIKKNEKIDTSTDHEVFRALYEVEWTPYLVYGDMKGDCYTIPTVEDLTIVEQSYAALPTLPDTIMFSTTKSSGKVYEWTEGAEGEYSWVATTDFIQPVVLLNNVVPSHIDVNVLRERFKKLMGDLTASTVPVYYKNNPDDDADVQVTHLDNDPLNVNVVNDPVNVNVVNDLIDVNVTNESVDVNVINESVPVTIENQPITVTESGGEGADLLKLFEEMALLVI